MSLCCTPNSSSRCKPPRTLSNSTCKPSSFTSTLAARRSNSISHVPVPSNVILLMIRRPPSFLLIIEPPHHLLKPPLPKPYRAIHQQIRLPRSRNIAVMRQHKIAQTLRRRRQRQQLLHLVILRHAPAHLCQPDVQLSEKAQLPVRRCQVIYHPETKLLPRITRLHPRLLAYLPAHRRERIRPLPHIQAALKKTADHVIAPGIHIHPLPPVEQNIPIARLNHRAYPQRIAQLRAPAPPEKLRLPRRHILLVTRIP